MTSIVTDFKSIRRKLERQEQKAEFEAKNPQPSAYERACGVVAPTTNGTSGTTVMPTGFEWSKFVKVKI